MVSACSLRARSRFLRARSEASLSQASLASRRRRYSSTGNLLSMGRYTVSPSREGRSTAYSTTALSIGLMRTLARYWVGGEHLIEQGGKLYFSPRSAQFYVGKHLFDVRHAPRQLLHFADPFIDGFQPFVDDGIALVQPVFEGGRELFVHRFAESVPGFWRSVPPCSGSRQRRPAGSRPACARWRC